MAEAATGFLEQLKSCIVWSWTYLWTVWFFIVLFLVYILRVPLKINDNLSTGKARAAGPVARPPLPRLGKLVQLARGRGRRGRATGRVLGAAPGARTVARGRPSSLPPAEDAAPQVAVPGDRRSARLRGPVQAEPRRARRQAGQSLATAPRPDASLPRC